MTTTSQTLRQAAGVILAEADRLDGKISGPQQMTTYAGRSVTVAEAWAFMLEEFANGEKPHEWRDWGTGVLPDQAGNNEREPPIYEGAKPFWQQMERQIPFVYDDHGQRFNSINCARRGGWPDFERNVRRLWAGPEGDAWRAAPENAERVARIKV